MSDESVMRTAHISENGLFRYALGRSWDNGKPDLYFIMLNPSTADALEDDPTIRRCMGFARALGYGGIAVRNLFAYRATDPQDLLDSAQAGIRVEGPENDAWIYLIPPGETIVCAWGACPYAKTRAAEVVRNLRATGQSLYCFGFTKSGAPKHPLYLPRTAVLESY